MSAPVAFDDAELARLRRLALGVGHLSVPGLAHLGPLSPLALRGA